VKGIGHTKEITNPTIDTIGQHMLKGYVGSFPYDKLPQLGDDEKAIINTDKSGQPGEHWMAVCRVRGKTYGYDSYGRSINKLIPIERTVTNDTRDKEQSIAETNCGARSLAWLLTVQTLGIESAMKV
jgi:hypothetical protein